MGAPEGFAGFVRAANVLMLVAPWDSEKTMVRTVRAIISNPSQSLVFEILPASFVC